jgi:homoserine O-acetyltransferase
MLKKMTAVMMLAALLGARAAAADVPAGLHANEADWVAPDFRFSTGETLHNVKFHYLTLGTPVKDRNGNVTNAVMLLHGTTNVGAEFLQPSLSSSLFGPGQPLDMTKYFIILPDALGRGGSSKPSDGMKGHFPHFHYSDMVEGQYRMLTEGLGIKHLRLLLGVSMGGMNAWQWAERYPDMMDAVMPIACMPTQISGRNMLIRRIVTQAIRHDPGWQNGDYQTQPTSYLYTLPLFPALTQGVGILQDAAPTYQDGIAYYDKMVERLRQTVDANDYLYVMEASSDYNPEPGLDKIKAKLLAVNFADDEVNPVELGSFDKLVGRVPNGKGVMLPVGPNSNGHFTLLRADVWAPELRALMAALPPV